jgi:hypothetical protein
MGRFSRGWALTRQSRDVLKGDASLALFPLLSTIFASLAMVSIWAPKHSAAIIKGRWGEGATGAATIGLVTVGFSFAIALVAIVGVVMLLEGGQALLGYVVLAVAVVLMFGVAVVSATLSQIFRVAVYEFALYGQTPGGFDGPQLQAAFQAQPA